MSKIKTHEECRKKVCLIEFKKINKNARIIDANSPIIEKIRKNYPELINYNPEDPRLPNALCETCRRRLYDGKITPLSNFTPIKSVSRTKTCAQNPCSICIIGRENDYNSSKKRKERETSCISSNNEERNVINENKTILSTKDLLEIQTEQACSNRKMRKMTRTLRKRCGRNVIEKNFEASMIESSKILEKFYSSTEKEFYINDNKKYEKRTIIHVLDIEKIIFEILEYRKYNLNNHIIRIGIDGGGSMLKFTMNVINTDPEITEKQLNDFNDSGVIKILILAVVESVKECYENLKNVFDCFQGLNRVKYHICSDLKLLNLVLGLQSSSSKHPCPYCQTDNLKIIDEERTIKNIKDNADNFNENGGKSKNAKLFKNCISYPLLPEEDNSVIDLCPPPELHLLLGSVKHLYDNMKKEWPGIDKWLKIINIEQVKYHGGSFNGNDCNKMLEKIDVLQSIAPLSIQKFIHAMRALNLVKKIMFWKRLAQRL